MFKVVAFDLDRTLADTIPMCITAFRNSISPYTDHELGTEEILHTFGLNEIGMVKAVVDQNCLMKHYMVRNYPRIRKRIWQESPNADILTVSPVNDELLSAVGKLTAEYGKIGGNLNQIARCVTLLFICNCSVPSQFRCKNSLKSSSTILMNFCTPESYSYGLSSMCFEMC